MYRPNNPRFNVPPVANRGHLYHGPKPSQRTPNNFRKDAPNVQAKDAGKSGPSQAPNKPPPALKPFGPEINKWKSSFAEIEENERDKTTGSDICSSPDRKRFHLYDPYELIKSDSEDNPSPEQPPDSSKSRGRWDIDASQKRQLSPEPPLFPIQQMDSAEIGSFSSAGGTTDHKDTDYRQEVPTTVRLSPPLCNFKQPPGYSGVSPEPLRLSRAATVGQPDQHVFGGPDQLPPPRPEVKADPGRNEVVPHLPTKELISCDLCEVELSNGQELEEHLDGKTHWDTLEYIQKHNNYDDMAIAFLQDVMMYKSRKSSRAIEDTALQALQEYDHMTKVEMFHCAACNAFVPTSAEAIQNHITSQRHMTNTKEFEARQRRSCLDKANTMMKELMPQFMSFAKGASPFE